MKPTLPASLPDDVASLKTLVLQLQSQLTQQTEKVDELTEQLHVLLHRQYGASSEKQSLNQLGLFNEAEQDQPGADQQADIDACDQAIHHASKKRGKPGRKPLPDSLPRVRVEHDLPATEKVCSTCGNTDLHRIGEEISEQLEIIPATVQVLQHVRPKYGCRGCEGALQSTPMPPQPIPGSIASPGLLAQTIVGKYQDGLPLYRMEEVLQRAGITLARATLANWMIRCGELIQPVINLMRDQLLSSPLIHCDETGVQVLKEPGRSAQSGSYMWVQVATLGTPIILFDYDPSRAGHVPERLLSDYQGYLQTDGYSGYNSLSDKDDSIIQQGCWAHARRKFDEAIKAQGLGRKGKSKGKKPATTGKAQVALNYIHKLYRIEHEIADLPEDQKHQQRQQCSQPVLGELRQWLEKVLPETLPKSSLGKALHYLHNQWDKLVRYCDAGYLRMDNNLAENAIRPFVIGRKNWLFSASQAGAHASANLYSLVETAKANGLEPWRYLTDILTALPTADSVEKLEVLLPWHVVGVCQGGEK